MKCDDLSMGVMEDDFPLYLGWMMTIDSCPVFHISYLVSDISLLPRISYLISHISYLVSSIS